MPGGGFDIKIRGQNSLRADGNSPLYLIDGIRIDGEYRYRFGANHYAFLRGRYDAINSSEARRNLSRWLAEASYQRPIAAAMPMSHPGDYYDLSRIRPEVLAMLEKVNAMGATFAARAKAVDDEADKVLIKSRKN